MLDWINNLSVDWVHIMPFACVVVGKPVPENRPALTRLIEQSFVGIVAAAIGTYTTIQVMQKDIDRLKEDQIKQEATAAKAVAESEARVTSQITEIRRIMLESAARSK